MRSVSFRARILLVVLVVSIAPFMLLGVWLSQATLRGGEELLRNRLAATLEQEAAAVAGAWIPIRSTLLDLTRSAPVATAFQQVHPALPDLDQTLADLDPAIESLSFRDTNGLSLGTLVRPEEARARRTYVLGGPLTVELPVETSPGVHVGTMAARLSFEALRYASPPATAGAVIVAFDPDSGDPLLPTPFDPNLAHRDRFDWNGEDWVVEFRPLTEPGVVLAAAAPLALFTQPFVASAQNGLLLLILVAAGGLAAAALLTRRMTGSLKRLADAAGQVGEGNLEGTTIDIESNDEVGRVAKAFDSMTRSLQRTLKELSQRSALEAVGEFAATLAHEVRNPLTSIKLDLQEVEESLVVGSTERALQTSAIEEVDRLDRTVGGALDIARSGRIERTRVDLVEIVRMAARSARSTFEEGDVVLETPAEDTPPLRLLADPDALVGALLNLLRNAAQALPPGGLAAIEVDHLEGEAIVQVRDSGNGIAPEILDRIFTPFFTTGSGGTGLGLAVAQRVVAAHGGTIEVESELSRGTLITVRLPTNSGTTRPSHR